jgi:hypothetical protein
MWRGYKQFTIHTEYSKRLLWIDNPLPAVANVAAAGSGSMVNMAKKVEIRNKFDKSSYHGSRESVIHLEALL